MASHQSALKAHRQSLKRRERNRELRSRLRGALKTVRAALDGSNVAAARKQLHEAISLIDKMVSKRIIHRNTAARHKSRLTARLAGRTRAA